MLLDPGRNPINDPILFKHGSAEYRDAYVEILAVYMRDYKIWVDLSRLNEDAYFELSEAFERSKDHQDMESALVD